MSTAENHYEELCNESVPSYAHLCASVTLLRRVPHELKIIEYKTDRKGAVVKPNGTRCDILAGWYVGDPNDENIVPGCDFMIVNARPFKTLKEAKKFASLCFERGLP